MKLKLLFFILVSLCFAPYAVADSSMQNRSDNWFFVGVSPVGIDYPTLTLRPLHFGIYLTDSFMIGGVTGQQTININQDDNDDSFYSNSYEPSFKSEGILLSEGAYLRFFGEDSSFNWMFAYHQRSWTGMGKYQKWAYNSATSSYTPKAAIINIQYTALVGSLGFGNQWLFDSGFTLGVDWYVDSRISTASATTTITDFGGLTEAEVQSGIDDYIKYLRKLFAGPAVTILTLGYAF